MAKPFSTIEAFMLLQNISNTVRRLEVTSQTKIKQCNKIKHDAEKLVEAEKSKVLKTISIEEINRDKKGIKIRTLQNNGFNTLADLNNVSVYRLSSIRGISEDAAYTIKRRVDELIRQAKDSVTVKISSDNRTFESSELIKDIAKYNKIEPLVEDCVSLLNVNRDILKTAVKKLSRGSNSIKRLFLSAEKKQQAADAFVKLKAFMANEFGPKAERLLSQLNNIPKTTVDDSWDEFTTNSIKFLYILDTAAPGIINKTDSVYGLPEDFANEIQDQESTLNGLKCKLRRYQEWGVKYILHQKRVLLGDEMGLGKTIQAIAAMVSLRNAGATHFAVICPASVITNWCREIDSKSDLIPIKVHGTFKKESANTWVENGGVAVVTYEGISFLNESNISDISMVVVDEAHYIKNPYAKRTKKVKEICTHTKRILFMTGTALENKVEEMIELISMLQPTIANQVRGMTYLPSAPQFKRKVIPVYYRRKREDVLTELPDLIENNEWCTLLAEEEKKYEHTVLHEHFMTARRVSWNIDDLKNSSKARRLIEIIDEAESEDRKVLVFSYYRETIRKIMELLGPRCINTINGSITPQRRQEIIDEFDTSPAGTVLCAQIMAGGTGLNIQSASVVVICEPQFKPSTENQAISRAYRMGQTRNVIVHRLLCENTIDERITKLLEEKQKIFNAYADESIAARENIEIDDSSYKILLQKEIERIKKKNKISQTQ